MAHRASRVWYDWMCIMYNMLVSGMIVQCVICAQSTVHKRQDTQLQASPQRFAPWT